ncbi:PRC-barrel domain-containing protein [Dankookia sp. P2]|uniref:PRC-barrel domain-containing protein n=1 Tax=Dankookia sp. P2 TaxID=3423955 RepID=UPI003D67C3DB
MTVQQQGQPQVNVERSGEPHVRVQQQAANERHSGASTAPAPAQSSGNVQQSAATPAANGMPLARTESLVGTNVVGADGKDAGEIQNLLIDGKGQVRAAVVEWGGFLGIGERTAAVPIDRIKLGTTTGTDRARLDMTKAELEKLPRYDATEASNYGRSQGWGDTRLFR